MYVLHHLWYTCLQYIRTTSEVLSATSQPSLLILATNFTMSIVSLGYPGKTDIHTDRNLCIAYNSNACLSLSPPYYPCLQRPSHP